jgi:DNA modification methylase
LKTEILNTGFAFPVYVWKDGDGKTWTLGGHQRVRVLTSLRSEGYLIPPVPIVYVEAKDYTEAKRRVLQDVSQFGKIETQGLYEFATDAGLSLPDLDAFDLPEIDMKSFGDEFFKDVNPDQDAIEDEVPASAPARAKLGDIWKLGRHRLMCGDSTDAGQVARLMDGAKADMFFTDPPYGDDHAGMVWSQGTVTERKKIKNDADIEWLGGAIQVAASHLNKVAASFIFFKWSHWEEIKRHTISLGPPKTVCVWDRGEQAASTFRINPVHEFCFYWGTLGDEQETGNLRNVWRARKERDIKRLHPTIKPIEIIEPCIRMCCPVEGSVLDLFGGSGSTLIACEKTGRTCYMSEIDHLYCDVILKRWEDYSGGKAERISEGPNPVTDA